ncbi:uncharacterized protein LOC110225151 isoform X4 [Arabidopsis lyrata subsp. lyrata]|uniref:uncharacterized protein LOC110225151 isoform X4 n=1 Tax=Arabidopsis lyrata subsp. lyrata TaxID=81972 RepID=UPI000A29C6C6|nr:uncharacterized protein LOC110225151 isoform X4 [Arabidopsis lyrata subsp. lyrata]|eukprot:XP_020869757.1 uncharacterized protein LOC110225151 isoform X4 [Arabidopsis lyrata subsp. lyrata]
MLLVNWHHLTPDILACQSSQLDYIYSLSMMFPTFGIFLCFERITRLTWQSRNCSILLGNHFKGCSKPIRGWLRKYTGLSSGLRSRSAPADRLFVLSFVGFRSDFPYNNLCVTSRGILYG